MLPVAVLSVSNTDGMITFLNTIFDIKTTAQQYTTPCRYSVIQVMENVSIVILHKDVHVLKHMIQKHVYLSVKDVKVIQQRALQLGAQLMYSNHDDCMFYGPEKTRFQIVNEKTTVPMHEILMASIRSDDTVPSEVLDASQAGKSFGPPPIPTLNVQVLSNCSSSPPLIPLIPNAYEPIPFETEIFKGIVQFFIRTEPMEPKSQVFFDGKRTFEIQLQGKFKRQPLGEIYVGGASNEKMEIGILNRAIYNAMIKFVQTMAPHTHFSFGDVDSHPMAEFPHAAGPLFCTIDRIVVTPPSAAPPPLGLPLVEDLEFRKFRLKTRSIREIKIDLDSIYSFSQNTNNIDFPTWCMVGIPLVKSIDMRSMFGDCPVRLLSYEIPDTVAKVAGERHPAKLLNYIFSVQLTRINADAEKPVDVALNERLSEEEDEERHVLIRSSSLDDGDDDVVYSDGEEEVTVGRHSASKRIAAKIFGVLTSTPSSTAVVGDADTTPRLKRSTTDDDADSRDPLGVGRWFRKQINPEAIDVAETSEVVPIDVYMETDGDLRYCPACIESVDPRKEGRRKILFLIPWMAPSANKEEFEESVELKKLVSLEPRIRSFSDFCKKIPIVPIPKNFRNKKMSIFEKQRRVIVESYRELHLSSKGTDPALVSYLSKVIAEDINFLNDHPVSYTGKSVFARSQEKWEGSCCLALSRRHFVEGHLVLSSTEMTVLKTRDSKRAIWKLPVHLVMSVRSMRPEETPFQGFKFFIVETFARCYYFMVRSDKQLQAWLKAFSTLLPSDAICTSDDELDYSSHAKRTANTNVNNLFGDVSQTYYARSPNWSIDKRRILNFRSIIFTSEGLPHRLREFSPNGLVESILEKAFTLSEESESISKWIAFMNDISALQTIDLYDLSETEKAALYLNLYHTMALHGFLLFGPPASWASWPTFFNSVTYILSFDIVSIAEMEHNILRAAMSRPSPLLSKITAPNTQFPGLALLRRDFRLNFCINNGSRSIQIPVPIYKPEKLDKQLDKTTSSYLEASVTVDSQKRVVVLPKICSWFLSDFVTKKTLQNGPVVGDTLRVIVHYLTGEAKVSLKRMLGEGPFPSVKFQQFTFRCKAFSKQIDVEDDS